MSVRDLSILIVEDDPGAVEAFEQILKGAGYSVRVAQDGSAAAAELKRAIPAAILLDLHLPITNGLDWLRQLRATERYARIPVAVVTGDYFVEEATARDIGTLGARIHFNPLWEEELLQVVENLLSGK